MNFAHLCVKSGAFPWENKHETHISNFCSGMPLRKVHELAFLLVWFAGVTPDVLFKEVRVFKVVHQGGL